MIPHRKEHRIAPDTRGGGIAPALGGGSLGHCSAMPCRQAIASNRREAGAIRGCASGQKLNRHAEMKSRSNVPGLTRDLLPVEAPDLVRGVEDRL
jgi:hypothetical protein